MSSSPPSTCCGPTSGSSTASPSEENEGFAELHWKEGLVLAPLVALIVFIGVYPKPMLERIEPSVERLIAHVERRSDYEEPEVAERGPIELEQERPRKLKPPPSAKGRAADAPGAGVRLRGPGGRSGTPWRRSCRWSAAGWC